MTFRLQLRRVALALALGWCAATPTAFAGDDDIVAIKAATVVTVAGDAIKDGVVVIEDGKITAVGKPGDVKIPAGAKILEVKDGFCMPGIVNPYSRLGTFSRSFFFGGPGGGFSNKSNVSPTDSLYTRQSIFEEIAETGLTTAGVVPGRGGGFSGTLSVIRSRAHGEKPTKEDFVLAEKVMLRLGFGGGEAAKSGLKTLLSRAKSEKEKIEKAKKRRADWEKKQEAKRKREEAKRKKEAKKSKDKDKKKTAADDEKKKKKKPEGPKVPEMKANLENIVAAREGKLRVMLELTSPGALAHLTDVIEDHPLDLWLVTSGRAAVVMKDTIVEKKWPVMLTPSLTTLPNSRARVNPAAILDEAGVDLCFRPSSDGVSAMRGYFFNLAGMVKTGLKRETALRAVTLAPAKWLDVDDRVGSLEKGKDGNVLLFSGDPLASPLAELRYVVLDGKVVYDEKAHHDKHGHHDEEED